MKMLLYSDTRHHVSLWTCRVRVFQPGQIDLSRVNVFFSNRCRNSSSFSSKVTRLVFLSCKANSERKSVALASSVSSSLLFRLIKETADQTRPHPCEHLQGRAAFVEEDNRWSFVNAKVSARALHREQNHDPINKPDGTWVRVDDSSCCSLDVR